MADTAARIVGKNRNATSTPRMTAVGAPTLDRNDDNSPGGVETRTHPVKNTGERFQNMSTWNSENTAIRSPANRMSASRTPKTATTAAPPAASRQRPCAAKNASATTASAPAPAGPAAEPQVVPTIAQASATSFTGTATYKTPAFLKWRPASPLPTRAPTNPHTVANATMNSTQPGSVK